MKKTSLILMMIAICFAACNNETETTTDNKKEVADSLNEEVDNAHMVGMVKMPDIEKAMAAARTRIDSIAKLPAAAQQASASLKARLELLVKDLEHAASSMNTWMEDFRFDSAKNDLEKRISYLTVEKVKVDGIKTAILNSLAKADSILR
jgi:hypothetical protein